MYIRAYRYKGGEMHPLRLMPASGKMITQLTQHVPQHIRSTQEHVQGTKPGQVYKYIAVNSCLNMFMG